MKVKNWSRFQHYADRRPPWIKLHRRLIDEREWGQLPNSPAKTLIMLWLIASDTGTDGELPTVEDIAYLARMKPADICKHLQALAPFIENHATDTVADAASETETEAETETERISLDRDMLDFDLFWSTYPKRRGKGAAEKAWIKTKAIRPPIEALLSALNAAMLSQDWAKNGGQYIPNPATWLNQKRWTDEHGAAGQPRAPQPVNISAMNEGERRKYLGID